MRKGLGILCILLGALCLLGAVGVVVYNRWEAENASQVTRTLLQEFQALPNARPSGGIGEAAQEAELSGTEEPTMPGEMATVLLDGYDCIGLLNIPVLELELPVLTDWSYQKLRKAPCLYYGTYYEPDFVIAAHNYASHFGRLSQLRPGDLVMFTDVHGVVRYYEVVLLETLPKEATKEMITSGFDLSLYTCTPGGSNRVTVRCKAVKEK